MQYIFTSYEVHFPERRSTWTGFRSFGEAALRAGADGVVVVKQFTAEVPAWRLAGLDAEIAEGRQEAVRS